MAKVYRWLAKPYRALLALVALGLLVFLVTALWWGAQRHEYITIGSGIKLYNLGVKDVIEGFKNSSNVDIRVILRNTGDLMRLLSDGSICFAFTASPYLESLYLSKGVIEWHGVFAYSYLIVAGPSDDPANVSGARSLMDAFKRIYMAGEEGKARFISRGDLSAEHVREMLTWNLTGFDPRGRAWYIRTAQGPVQTALIAENMRAYLLMDEGTYIALNVQDKIRDLKILYANSSDPLNLFVASMVSSKNDACKSLRAFILELREYVMGPGQAIIEEKYSPQGLLYPAKGKERELREAWESLSKIGG
ncbi:MAG: hypothetical protein P3X22_003995 [Thermoprotei archaeon]|nr:hypothetical protein [Thermoprotei archaeon]